MSFSFLSSLTRHCWSGERKPRSLSAVSSSSYFLWSSWSFRNSWLSAVRRSITISVSGMGTSRRRFSNESEDAASRLRTSRRLSIVDRVRPCQCVLPWGLPRFQSCRLQGCLGISAYTPAVDRLSRLAVSHEVRRRRLEVRRDRSAVTQVHLLDGPPGHEGDQRESAVHGDTHVGARRHHPQHAPREAIECGRRRRLRRARKERHVLRSQ